MKKRKKEHNKLEIFKKGFKKNEVIIYAIALMLVTAGYFNYTANIDENTIETYTGQIQNTAKDIGNVEKIDDTGDEKNQEKFNDKNNKSNKDENNMNKEEQKEQENIANKEKEAETKEKSDINNENKKEQSEGVTVASDAKSSENKEDKDDIGDAKLVNSNDIVKKQKSSQKEEKNDSSSDYFVNSKLERDTNYADMISTYTKIIEDGSVSETQKSIAMKEITKITNTKNAISVCENILSIKGLENYVVLVNKDSINVVVKTKDRLTPSKVAQIQNVVSREFNCKIENIHITEK